ncbi:MAG TPA: argininosuccinate lyase [Gammaproteobacteria bacterium]|nr:argininosuccinate lyase [Gammaproteobacteria bacterium]
MRRLWDKGLPLDERILEFTAGEDHRLDERLVEYDVRASIAHARMLEAQGLLDAKDAAAICKGLRELGDAHAAGRWSIALADEDAHSALEARLVGLIGEAGGRVHLGRSRNDQVLAALRLYLRDAVHALAGAAAEVGGALDALASAQGHIALPGFTHMQPAMPSSVALWAGGFAAELRDDREALLRTLHRIDQNPLGSAAGYGVPNLPLDREATRRELGFARTQEPVTAVQLSRGKAEAAVIFELSLLAGDLGRLASDLLLFYMAQLAYVALPAEMTTGSSIMPQKRNPDVFELLRAVQSSITGALVEALGLSAKLPSGYHRDLQRLKGPLFRSIDLAADALEITAHALKGVRFRPENIDLPDEIHAAARANALVVEHGLPFREAYRRVAAELAAEAEAGQRGQRDAGQRGGAQFDAERGDANEREVRKP